ncbi:MAG: branched-chain amino acid ABC transporter permease [Candidatus Latescibacterota bacterium]|nr:MAG: branched-chain amino acid ABC transporter permease [Candidatus Latescibacterota bacterium]RKY64138.1 MAG: branched-chain amino acid ABC transporter permease [Candidatus Latescibacterota bacterium]
MGRGDRIGLGALAGVVALCGFLVGNPYYLGVLTFVGMYVLVATGLSLLMGYAGQISLGHAAFFAVGAYTSGLLTTKAGLQPVPALSIALALAGLLAVLVGLPTLRLRGHYLAMATLGFGEIVHIFLNASVSLTGGPSGFGGIPSLGIGPLSLESPRAWYIATWAFSISALVLTLNLIHSRVGRALRTLHTGEVAASSVGVHVAKYKLYAFVWSALLACLAGSLYAHFVTFVSPSTFGLKESVLFVTMVVVGGISSVWGAVIGAVLLGLLPEVLRGFRDYDILVYGGILLSIMLFAPQGIFGALRGLLRR